MAIQQFTAQRRGRSEHSVAMLSSTNDQEMTKHELVSAQTALCGDVPLLLGLRQGETI